VLDVPGHTAIHVAYYGGNSLFCGDTLFGCGCGRIFDGSCEQLYQSLQKLAQLPDDTQVYCGHEYTLDNIHFALSVDPHNAALINRQTASQKLVAQGLPTLPSTLAQEKATNPFLRCHTHALRSATGLVQDVAVFCAAREMKNHFNH
jgi:hydroxyacylglutathione hydrolase